MRTRTSITLPKELLRAIDTYAIQRKETRAAIIEGILWAFIEHRTRDEQNARDLEIINRNADSLNREPRDVLEYSLR